jgi:hypothetical protein
MEKKEMTFGEQLVGLNFNPSGNENVDKAKKLCAELADLVYDNIDYDEQRTPIQEVLAYSTFSDILKAQMMVVKTLTNKY